MDDKDRCEECGSWEAECSADHPVKGCSCVRCLSHSYHELEKQYALLLAEKVKLNETLFRLQYDYQRLTNRYMPEIP